MTGESSFNYFEFILLAMFAACWLILEWQGKRLDKKREAEKAKQDETSSPSRK